ncbi:hypothetical protein Cni_G24693 [Canna indica]|uniref:Calcium uniporter protein C-terminal domain-containing protein n=1 Tax=Canna indica TaxID=4628 RepID=A0AAQ3KVL4_9LILI|nr:hypothetical protein Cni_G24693 [Canna indica]
MWRSFSSSSSRSLLRTLLACPPAKHPIRPRPPLAFLCSSSSASSECGSSTPSAEGGSAVPVDSITFTEAKRLMHLANVESLKLKLESDGEEIIAYSQLLEACEGMGVARSREEAAAFARVLDEAGVVLLFRDKVYLHPHKVVDLVRKAVPLSLTPENDPRREELKQMQKKKEEIDALAHRQVRRILLSGLAILIAHISLFFRLTFWEFSWDVMEPIAFFTTTAGILAGYGYFLFTSRDPTYQDLMKRLFLSRQKKLFQKHNFNMERYMELRKHCRLLWSK